MPVQTGGSRPGAQTRRTNPAVRSKCLAVETAALHRFPSGAPVVAGQRIHALHLHFLLYCVRDGLDLGRKLIGHAAQLSQFLDFCIEFSSAHCNTSIIGLYSALLAFLSLGV